MIGIALQLTISWLLLKYFQHKNLEAIGLTPTSHRMLQLAAGLAFAIIYACLYQIAVAAVVHNPYQVNPAYTLQQFTSVLYYYFKAIWFEDLLFRGALLYLLICKIGNKRGILISCITFGIYHWFTRAAWGNPATMLIIFITTASTGYIFALAFERSGSMYLAAGLHLGINLANGLIFSQDHNLGTQLLVKTFTHDPVSPAGWIGLPLMLMHYIGFQTLCYLWLKSSSRLVQPVGFSK